MAHFDIDNEVMQAIIKKAMEDFNPVDYVPQVRHALAQGMLRWIEDDLADQLRDTLQDELGYDIAETMTDKIKDAMKNVSLSISVK